MTTWDVMVLVFSGAAVCMAIMACVYERYGIYPLRKKLAVAENELKTAQAEIARLQKHCDSRGRFTK